MEARDTRNFGTTQNNAYHKQISENECPRSKVEGVTTFTPAPVEQGIPSIVCSKPSNTTINRRVLAHVVPLNPWLKRPPKTTRWEKAGHCTLLISWPKKASNFRHSTESAHAATSTLSSNLSPSTMSLTPTRERITSQNHD